MLQWRWEMAPCVLSVLACISAAGYIVWRYEGGAGEGDGNKRRMGVVYDEDGWMTCFRNVHPAWLLMYRLTCSTLFTALAAIIISRNKNLLFFYTEWTFLLVTLYFWLAAGYSVYGCRKFDSESLDGQGDTRAGFWGYLLQVIYQTTAGAVMLTDFIYWLILFPNILKRDHHITFWSVMAHSFNAFFLLGDCALNRMRYPWFRIAYFLLWTSVYVLFQWTVHAFSVINWWPYPFLDLSAQLAPLWYIVVGLLQLPCYFAFMLALILKRRLFAKWFPVRFIQA